MEIEILLFGGLCRIASCSVFGVNEMQNSLRDVNGLFLRFNHSFFTLY